jgi:UTP--glucose-1-phosphate uridylyltransferase
MKIKKAVLTAASPKQRALPLQRLIDVDGAEKPVLRILVEEILRAHIEEICVVIHPADEAAYTQAVGEYAGRLRFVPQREPLGYGHAVYCARDFLGNQPFLHLVADHLYLSHTDKGCAEQLVDRAQAEACSVSAVQATRESLLPHFGAVGGPRVPGRQDLYRIDTVLEKPTPTEAEQRLVVPGLRAGQFLCFFGLHVLTPTVMDILERLLAAQPGAPLSAALAELARREQYLALESPNRRYDLGAKYGVFIAQLALALNGKDRDDVLCQALELLALRQGSAAAGR